MAKRTGAAGLVATILLTLRIENNSKFVRGKKRVAEHIESFYLEQFNAKRRPNGEYELAFCAQRPKKDNIMRYECCN
jgi:hypothetical protein